MKTPTDKNDHMARTVRAMTHRAFLEIDAVLGNVPDDLGEHMCNEILKARRIACYGVGREGLMMKALCMRLMHLGLNAHVVGDMTSTPVGKGDLLLVSAGPGSFSTVLALLSVAREAGARTMVVTAQPTGARSAECGRGDLSTGANHGGSTRTPSRVYCPWGACTKPRSSFSSM